MNQNIRTSIPYAISLAILMVLGYLTGRLGWLSGESLPTDGIWTNATWWWLLGAIIVLTLGLWLISWYVAWRNSQPTVAAGYTSTAPTTINPTSLDQLEKELLENQALLNSRKGSTGLVARLGYVLAYWPAALGTGQLTGLLNPTELNQIALAYYWLEQANHLEVLAYNAKNSGQTIDAEFVTAKLISEIRLLDDPLAAALDGALAAVRQARYNTV
ncbi:hypothetical protein IPG36_05670 [bacterium]|nr:MAG: hypothetical protein IPG36_05670 [bacterium]